MLKKLILGSGLVFIASLSTITKADENHGCRALMCFAGGKGLSECEPTIKKVIRDMAKGKSFPHCSFVSSNSENTSTDKMVSTRTFAEFSRNSVCRDGVTHGTRTIAGYYCNTIEISIDPSIAGDKSHQKQYFNY